MIRIESACAAAMAMALSLAVQAQSNVGEVLDGGGKQLSRDELSSLLPGAMLSGPTATGGEMTGEVKGDGGITGTIRTIAGRSGGYFGKWSVNEAGQFCRDIKISIGTSNSTDSACSYYFKLADRYFAADTAERSAPVLARNVVKK